VSASSLALEIGADASERSEGPILCRLGAVLVGWNPAEGASIRLVVERWYGEADESGISIFAKFFCDGCPILQFSTALYK
jgi:hypothetical protein